MKKVTQNHEHSESPRDIDWEAFGRNVRKYRKQKNLTQEQLAERCHMQPNSISRIEKGVAGTKISGLLELADALDVTPNSLLQGYYNVKNDRYAERFYALKSGLTDSVTAAIDRFFAAEGRRQDVDNYEKNLETTRHIIDPAMDYSIKPEPTADPNLHEKTNRHRKPHERE